MVELTVESLQHPVSTRQLPLLYLTGNFFVIVSSVVNTFPCVRAFIIVWN